MLQENIKNSEFEYEIDKRELEDLETKLQVHKQKLKDLYKNNPRLLTKPWLCNKKAIQLHQEIRKFRNKIKFWKGELEQDLIYLKENRESLEEFLKETATFFEWQHSLIFDHKESENLPLG